MSNFGQGVLAVAGGVIGFFVGGPTGAMYGFQIGLLAGTALFPTQLPGVSGPRLSDYRTTNSEVGGPVTIVYGTFAVAGTVIDVGPIEEVANTEEVGGKGAPSQEQTTYSYFQPIMIGLSEGTIDGILRIWENGELMYDARQDAQSDGDATIPPHYGSIGDALSGVLAQTRHYQDSFTLYLGDEEQLPDPTFEAIHGVGEQPAHRGLAYIVYHRRQLQEKQGLRHPNFKFEVVRNGEFQCIDTFEYSNEVLHDWHEAGLPINFDNLNQYITDGYDGFDFSEAMEALRAKITYAPNGPWQQTVYVGGKNSAAFGDTDYYNDRLGGRGFNDQTSTEAIFQYANIEPDFYAQALVDGAHVDYVCDFFGDFGVRGVTMSEAWGVSLGLPIDASINTPIPMPPYDIWEGATRCTSWYEYTNLRQIEVARFPNVPKDPCEDLPKATIPGFCVRDGDLVAGGEWTRVETGDPGHDDTFLVLQIHKGGLGGLSDPVRYPLNPCMPTSDPKNTEDYWTAAYQAAVSRGDIEPGKTYVPGGSGSNADDEYPHNQGFAYVRPAVLCTGQESGISIAEIITDICGRVGITRIDVTELAAKEVAGYGIGRIMPARAAIEPLRSVGFFDIVESPPILAFRVRGRAPSAVLTQADLGAHDEGEEAPPLIRTKKLQDVELPRSVRIHYIAPSRDYEDGEQFSPKRITTEATNDVDIELAICLDDSQAKQAAEIIWADAWRSRWVEEWALDQRWLGLEPADVVLAPIDGLVERVRVTSIDDAIPLLRKFEGCRDEDGNYVSYAVADPPDRPPNVIRVLSPTALLLLDIPSLRSSDNDAGVYAATVALMRDGVWNGAVIRYSTNDGDTFVDLGTTANQATGGEVVTPAGAGIATMFDDLNELVVRLARGSLANRPDADVLIGANAAAVGVHGRWELIQFGSAEEVSDGTWRLTHLLRGRKGTEHLIGTGEAGDTFVLLSGPGIVRIPLDATEIGVERTYKVISIGAPADTGIEQQFTTQGVALLPYSPAHLEAPVDYETGDILISWIRRGRLGQELQGGADIPLSEAFERYDVEILTAAGVVVRTVTVDNAQELAYPYAEQLADFGRGVPYRIRVYQISDIVGRGTPAELLTSTSIAIEPPIPPIDYPKIYARTTFSGTPDGSETVVVRGQYTPKGAAGTTLYLLIDGAGKTSSDDYADELYAYLTGLGLPATANVSQPTSSSVQIRAEDGDYLNLYAYAAHPETRWGYDTEYDPGDPFHDDPWQGGTYRIPQPISGGVREQISIDLYQHLGGFVEGAPDQSNAYRVGGAATIRFTVFAVDFDVNLTMTPPYHGQEILLDWSVTNNFSDLRAIALNNLVQNDGTPKPEYSLLARFADRLQTILVPGGRQAVGITMKDGYRVSVDVFNSQWVPKGSHPSGYLPATQRLVEGEKRYPAGAKWMSGFFFGHFNQPEFYASGVGGFVAGQAIEITVDAITASYTIDAGEAADLNTTDNALGSPLVATYTAIQDDLKTQLETGGQFKVLYEVDPNGWYGDWRIERTVANTPVTFSAQVTGYDLTIVNEAFDEDTSP